MKRIAFLTDVHLGEQFPIDNNVNVKQNFERVLTDLSSKNISEIIFGGDIGEHTSLEYFFESLKNYSINLILGNHDKFKEVKKFFFKDDKKDELFYSFEDEFYKYIFLDTSIDEISDIQIEWLKSKLKTIKKLILFIHHPVLEIETPVDKLYPLKNRDLLKSVLVENGQDITIFCGHYHMNDEQTYKNIKQFTTQSLSFQLEKKAVELKIDNSKFGYRIIEISKDKIETELITFETKFHQ